MATTTDATDAVPDERARRQPLSRERVLRGAVDLADADGLDALTMRRLGQHHGVEAMSLYSHVRNKEDVLDGVADMVAGEIPRVALPDGPIGQGWRAIMREQVMAARAVMLRHPWAPRVFETRTDVGVVTMTYMDHLLAIMRAGGFSWDLAHHAMHAVGSRALGFTQELFAPAPGEEASEEEQADLLAQMRGVVPHIAAMLDAVRHDPDEDRLGWCDDETEFAFGLDVLLDGLEARRRAEAG